MLRILIEGDINRSHCRHSLPNYQSFGDILSLSLSLSPLTLSFALSLSATCVLKWLLSLCSKDFVHIVHITPVTQLVLSVSASPTDLFVMKIRYYSSLSSLELALGMAHRYSVINC